MLFLRKLEPNSCNCWEFQSKLSTGLSLKKKGVDSLVAKWQNIQEENKRQQK